MWKMETSDGNDISDYIHTESIVYWVRSNQKIYVPFNLMGYKTNIMVSSEFLVGSLPRHLVAIFGYILVSDIFLYLYPLIRRSDRPLSTRNDTYLVLKNKLDTKLNDPSLEYLPINDSE